jgi:hypothetical protein
MASFFSIFYAYGKPVGFCLEYIKKRGWQVVNADGTQVSAD